MWYRYHASLSLIAAALSAFPLNASAPAQSGEITAPAAELPWISYPPNHILREESVAGHVTSVLAAKGARTSAEYFVEVPSPGTYRVAVEALRTSSSGIFQLSTGGDEVGSAVDLYADRRRGDATWQRIVVGNATFLRPGNMGLKFLVTGKNPQSTGYELLFGQITLTPTTGFSLLSPNGTAERDSRVFLRWAAHARATQFEVVLDGKVLTRVPARETSFRTAGLQPGHHRWWVNAIFAGGGHERSGTFTFHVGPPAVYPYREFADGFEGGTLAQWSARGMSISSRALDGRYSLGAKGSSVASPKAVLLGTGEGEVSATVSLDDPAANAGVGFRAGDGTEIRALVDAAAGELRIERRNREYSILEVTPRKYWVQGWKERREGGEYVWTIASVPVKVRTGSGFKLSLAYSRRSSAVFATLALRGETEPITVRELCDTRTPDRPFVATASGAARFDDFGYRQLNKLVYKWDPNSLRIVLRPGKPGDWDGAGAFNPAIYLADGKWNMFYRGNSLPAPPDAPPSSQIGLASSADGLHWTKAANNPIVKRMSSTDSVEDPDVLVPDGSKSVFLEYRAHEMFDGEVMTQTEDLLKWSNWWKLPRFPSHFKVAAFIDTHNNPRLPEFTFAGKKYRYLATIEEGRILYSNDLHEWVSPGEAFLGGVKDHWCNYKECIGDAFVDHDRNIRVVTQIGTGTKIVGNRLCIIGEDVLDGQDPTHVLWRSDLPWMPAWYGDAPTGDLNDYTATNGSVFPGQTILKDGYLWHFSGGNNTYSVLVKCPYGPQFEYRDLEIQPAAAGKLNCRLKVRNVGSMEGQQSVALSIDGVIAGRQPIRLKRDEETPLSFTVKAPKGVHSISIGDLRASLAGDR
ncbi:MAG TPA: hypothetical protein VN736_00185 [Candidatus Limnocylindrales bacterium]|nr:hypothetical protein [Candidatus Limnocylindrales bacterium]